MRSLVQIPKECVAGKDLGQETGLGYHVVSVDLKDGTHFDQVVVSEGHIIEVRGYDEIPFTPESLASVNVNHKRWNFRDKTDSRKKKSRAAAA